MRLATLALLLISLLTAPVSASLIPKIANPGFEETAAGNDAPGWGWWTNCSARFHGETVNPHSGKRCLVFASDSELSPNVFGRLNQGIPVLPGTRYELSMWVRGVDVSGFEHVTDWSSCTLSIPGGTYGWRKISVVFRTKNDQSGLNLGINIVDKCRELAVDDISLRPVGTPITGQAVHGSYLVQGEIAGDDVKAPLAVMLTSSLQAPAKLKAVIKAEDEVIFTEQGTVKPGENTFEWEWNSGSVLTRKLELTLQVTDSQGRSICRASQEIGKVSPAIILSDLNKIEAGFKGEFAELYSECESKGIPLDYPRAAKTTADQFIPYAREDTQHGQERRADFMVTDLRRALDEAIVEMKAYLRHPKLAPIARRYKTGRVKIDGISFVGDRMDSNGKTDRGPLFFCGYGHFSQARKDMDRWPGYGVNIIQSAEFGPSAVFPEEGKVDLTAVHTLVKTLDDAAKKNVKVDFLISPHYFPAWAMQKWPHLGTGGFCYVVDAPEAKKIIEDFLRIVVPMIKDKPALHSFCLSNEPAFANSTGCYNTRPLWNAYMAKVHGDIQTLNRRYGTSYKSFDEVPVGGGFDDPQFYDYCTFNKERFAGWHKWMADVIHSMAPDIPTHAKLCMVLELPTRQNSAWGVDPEMFANDLEINGNDCYFGTGDAAAPSNWQLQNMVYDLQRSMAEKPIFNSENHPTTDGSTNYVPPEHFRTCIWQGAVHGQGATTFWVWERNRPWLPSQEPSFYGNVMDRPGCALAVGTTCLDLNRFSEEVTALQKKAAPVAILYSKASFIRDPGYIDTMNRVYAALNFCGVKIDFISEKQLSEGKGKDYRVIVLPQATRVTNGAFSALGTLPERTRLVVCGDSPQKDPYNKPLPAGDVERLRKRAAVINGKLDSREMWPLILTDLNKAGALPSVSVVDASTNRPVWGVEWLPTTVGKRLIVNIVNLTGTPVDVKIFWRGKEMEARDLLSLLEQGKVKRLMPITPVLAELQGG